MSNNNVKRNNLIQMASIKHVCQLCGKGPVSANNRSHSMLATKTVKKPNTQPVKVAGLKIQVCTRCLRTMSKNLS